MKDPYATPEWQAFTAQVRASPYDDTVRLVAADWLDENGDPDRAAFIRFQVAAEAARSHRYDPDNCHPGPFRQGRYADIRAAEASDAATQLLKTGDNPSRWWGAPCAACGFGADDRIYTPTGPTTGVYVEFRRGFPFAAFVPRGVARVALPTPHPLRYYGVYPPFATAATGDPEGVVLSSRYEASGGLVTPWTDLLRPGVSIGGNPPIAYLNRAALAADFSRAYVTWARGGGPAPEAELTADQLLRHAICGRDPAAAWELACRVRSADWPGRCAAAGLPGPVEMYFAPHGPPGDCRLDVYVGRAALRPFGLYTATVHAGNTPGVFAGLALAAENLHCEPGDSR